MAMRRDFLLAVMVPVATLAAAAALPAWGEGPPVAASAAAVPDLSGIWWHPSLPGFEPPASGPGPVTNRSRRNGVSDYDQLVGDYTNPILKPQTAAIVRQFGELSLKGITYPSPANQCWPEPVPYIYKNFALQIFQQGDRITMIYDQDHEVRHVRMNAPHPEKLTPSWYGDSVGRYEGDALVIDTVGTKTDRPFAMLDLYGTPYSKALHVVERYRLIDYAQAREALERNSRENIRFGPGIQSLEFDPDYRGRHLQLQFTVDDEGVFAAPWTATITYAVPRGTWEEHVCAESRLGYFSNGNEAQVPTAAKPDF